MTNTQYTALHISNSGNVCIGGTPGSYYKLDIQGSKICCPGIDINGDTYTTGKTTFGIDKWNITTDGKNRFLFTTNGRTYFGSQNGYEWRSAADANIMTLDNAGSLSTYNQTYITRYTSVTQTASQSGFNYLIFANNWWYQGHTYGNLNVWVAGGGWYWAGRVHLTQNNGLNAVNTEYVNNISNPTNFWDSSGGNYICFTIVASTTLYYRFTA